MLALSDLATAAYCPRQLYYQRREDDHEPPDEAHERQELAFRYADLRTADDATLRDAPVDLPPAAYRTRLDRLATRDDWDDLVDPTATRVYLRGRDCHGTAYKLLDSSGDDPPDGATTDGTEAPPPPVPTLVSPGVPPESGVWQRQSVRAVGLAKALAWEREREIPRALVEYPAHAVVREVRLTTRKKAAYREALRTARSIDGPPPRLRGSTKCKSCEYREECGVQTRSLRSLLGL